MRRLDTSEIVTGLALVVALGWIGFAGWTSRRTPESADSADPKPRTMKIPAAPERFQAPPGPPPRVGVGRGQWYEGGTLHRATMAEWRRATSANRLATAADMALKAPRVAATVKSSGTMSTLRPYATALEACVSEQAVGRVAELAAACIILEGWQ